MSLDDCSLSAYTWLQMFLLILLFILIKLMWMSFHFCLPAYSPSLFIASRMIFDLYILSWEKQEWIEWRKIAWTIWFISINIVMLRYWIEQKIQKTSNCEKTWWNILQERFPLFAIFIWNQVWSSFFDNCWKKNWKARADSKAATKITTKETINSGITKQQIR